MTSTDHYLEAERLLEHATTMAAQNVLASITQTSSRQAGTSATMTDTLIAALAVTGVIRDLGRQLAEREADTRLLIRTLVRMLP